MNKLKILIFKIYYQIIFVFYYISSILVDLTKNTKRILKAKLYFGALLIAILSNIMFYTSCKNEQTFRNQNSDTLESLKLSILRDTSFFNSLKMEYPDKSIDEIISELILRPENDFSRTSCYIIELDSSEIISNEVSIFEMYQLTEQPEFYGGNDSLIKFIQQNLIWDDNWGNVQGKVYLKFVITSNGKVSDVFILRGIDNSVDAEAIRVVKLLPDFIPGKIDGEPVNSWYVLPITFKLQ
jgi:TonB family protein